jgi:hypothetical protein
MQNISQSGAYSKAGEKSTKGKRGRMSEKAEDELLLKVTFFVQQDTVSP